MKESNLLVEVCKTPAVPSGTSGLTHALDRFRVDGVRRSRVPPSWVGRSTLAIPEGIEPSTNARQAFVITNSPWDVMCSGARENTLGLAANALTGIVNSRDRRPSVASVLVT